MGYGYVPIQLYPYEEGGVERVSPPGLAASTP